MVGFVRGLFKNMKISTEIFITTSVLVLFMSVTYMVVNFVVPAHQVILSKIYTEVTNQLNQIYKQQTEFLSFFADISAETVHGRVDRMVEYTQHTANIAFFNNMFDSWSTFAEPQPIGCQVIPVSLPAATAEEQKSALNKLGELYGQFVGDRYLASGFISSKHAVLPADLRQKLTAKWGKNLKFLEWTYRHVAELAVDRHLGFLTLMVSLRNFAGTDGKPATDYFAVFAVFPGTCTSVEYYQPRAGSLASHRKAPQDPRCLDLLPEAAGTSTGRDSLLRPAVLRPAAAAVGDAYLHQEWQREVCDTDELRER